MLSSNICVFIFIWKILRFLSIFWVLKLARSSEGIYLCQRKYTLDIIIVETRNLGSKPATFSMEPNHKLVLSVSPLLENVERYRRLVERLIYLSFTRSNLAYSVHVLSQFLPTPRRDHWDAAVRVVRYLKGCSGQGILLRSVTCLCLVGVILIGPLVRSHVALSWNGWFFLGILLFLGRQRNKSLCLDFQLKHIIVLWLLSHVSLSSWKVFFLVWGCITQKQWSYIVIVNLLYILRIIQHFINVRNMLKLIVILFEMPFKMVSLVLFMSLLPFNS